MSASAKKRVLVSGASSAGLSTAFWMSRLGYEVSIVEIAPGLRTGGTAVDLKGNTVQVVQRMGLLEQVRSNRLNLERWEFKNEHDVTERSLFLRTEGDSPSDDAFEIERTVLLNLLFNAVKDRVEVFFDESITALREEGDGVEVTFAKGARRRFDLVFGCDGIHSGVRSSGSATKRGTCIFSGTTSRSQSWKSYSSSGTARSSSTCQARP